MVAVPLTDREMRPDVPICASAVTSAAGLRNTHSACAPADTYVRAVQLRFYQNNLGQVHSGPGIGTGRCRSRSPVFGHPVASSNARLVSIAPHYGRCRGSYRDPGPKLRKLGLKSTLFRR